MNSYITASVVLSVVLYMLAIVAGGTFDLFSQSPTAHGLFVVIFVPMWVFAMLIVAAVKGDIK